MNSSATEKVVVKYPFINYDEILRLRGGAGGKGYVPVGELSEEQLSARRASELRRKQAQRARARGVTVQEYKDNRGKQQAQFVPENVQPALRERAERTNAAVLKRRDAAEKKKVDQETRAAERKAVREELERQKKADKENWGKSLWNKKGARPDLKLPRIGQSIRQNRNKLRTQLRKHLRKWVTKDDWEKVSGEIRKDLPLSLEIKKVYEFKGTLTKWIIDGSGHRDPGMFLHLCEPLVKRVTNSTAKKIRMTLDVKLKKMERSEGKDTEKTHTFRSGVFTILRKEEFEGNWSEMVSVILARISKHQLVGSGWTLEKIEKLNIYIDKYNPLAGKSWIQLPDWLAVKKAIVNIKNKGDDRCFPLAVAAGRLLTKYPDLKDLEKLPGFVKTKAKGLKMGDIKLPVSIEDITKFEDLNPDLNIVVYGIGSYDDTDSVVVLRSVKRDNKSKETVCLFFFGDESGNNHYAPIKNMSALISAQVSKGKEKRYVCHNCNQTYRSGKLLNEHQEGCFTHDCQQTVFVEKTIKFENPERTQRVPFVVYSDIESYNIKLPKVEGKNTVRLSEQTPSGLGYLIVGPDGYKKVYKKFDTAEEYANSLETDVREIHRDWFLNDKPLLMTPKDTELYNRTTKCYQCGFHLVQGECKVRDHDHFTGKFRGAACNDCNLKMKKPTFIPIYFHNLEGYDSHLIIREIAKLGEMTCIPHNRENYISFSVKLRVRLSDDETSTFSIRFLDSFKLMSQGLGSLVETLNDEDSTTSKEMLEGLKSGQFELLRRKGVYPYDWVDGPDKLKCKELPPIKEFYNTLTDEECSKEDYEHAKEVWNSFGIRTMQEYHDLYMKSDITQLTDIIEKFRDTCHKTYGLDPPWYFTAPGLSWDGMLRTTDVKLDTVKDPDMHLFIESSIRGGISVITKRHSKANHKYMKDYNPSEPSVFIIDLDRNNLYGEAMSDPLPTGDLEWMTEEELGNWNKFPEDVGCFLEVDMNYPDHLHDLHNDYPLACECMLVGDSITEKLVPNLYDKKNYVIHYKELEFCLKHGLTLEKIHRGLKFKQSPWLKPYISMNTDLRTKATTKFEKDFYKLMNNSVFGKTMENVRNRVDVKLVTDKCKVRRLNKIISNVGYNGSTVFSPHLAATETRRPRVTLNKPVYAGAAILSISKVKMVEFLYEYIKPKWGEKAKLLFTDTDSLCLEIHTEDFYKDIIDDVDEYFDTSEIPSDHRIVKELGFPVGKNKKELRKMKDEAAGKNITEFAGLRPKMYALNMEGDDADIKKCKGIKKNVVKKMVFDEYKKCLEENSAIYKTQKTLRNHDHRIYVEEMTKKALCGKDNKRVISKGGVDTLAWGHWRLRE